MSVISYGKVVIDIDIDEAGFIANRNTYEYAEKGYFSKKNHRSYQMLAAFNGEYSETVSMYFESGGSHCSNKYKEILDEILTKCSSKLKIEYF